MRFKIVAAVLSLAMPLSLVACATYQHDLARSQKAFEQNQHERALAILRALEIASSSQLTPSERAHYAYLRGMTDYRIGYRSAARHWLSVARSILKPVSFVELSFQARLIRLADAAVAVSPLGEAGTTLVVALAILE